MADTSPRTVAVVGASTKPERYSHQAVVAYAKAGWTVWPINPLGETVAGVPGFRSLAELPGSPTIVCLYVNPAIGLTLLDQVVALKPRALWLNPGADGPEIADAARAKGLHVVEACTLVVLRIGDPVTHLG